MDSKIQVTPDRLHHLRELIKINAEAKAIEARKILDDKKELNYSLLYETLKYEEIFKALRQFNEVSQSVINDVGYVFSQCFQHNPSEHQTLFKAFRDIVKLANSIALEKDFIYKMEEQYTTLLNDLEELEEVEFDTDKF